MVLTFGHGKINLCWVKTQHNEVGHRYAIAARIANRIAMTDLVANGLNLWTLEIFL